MCAHRTLHHVQRIGNLVIGGGVIGLATGARLARAEHLKQERVHHRQGHGAGDRLSTLVLEKNAGMGDETSARNSEVVHAGLYYPLQSLKTRLCLQGNDILYRLAAQYGIPHRRCGKWIVAQEGRQRDGRDEGDDEVQFLQQMMRKADDMGVAHRMRFLSSRERRLKEPNVSCVEALESEASGIIDTHKLMQFFLYALQCDGSGDLVCNTRVKHVQPVSPGDPHSAFLVYTEDPPCWILADRVVNCAGLYADRIAMMLQKYDQQEEEVQMKEGEAKKEVPCLHFWKGSYMGYRGSASNPIASRLIYPVPEKNIVGLGTHLTIDLMNHIRFGPNAEYLEQLPSVENDPIKEEALADWPIKQSVPLNDPELNVTLNFDYSVSEEAYLRDQFYASVSRYLPSLDVERLYPEYAGVRPKLQKPGDNFQDFHIRRAAPYRNFINMIGIESPGLTCSPAIANMVADMMFEDDPMLSLLPDHKRTCDF